MMKRSSITGGVIFRRFLSSESVAASAAKSPVRLLDFHIECPDAVRGAFNLDTANSKEVLKYKISQVIEKFKRHTSDTGTTIVQLAVMNEKIYNLARHFATHRKDMAGQRGFQVDIFYIPVVYSTMYSINVVSMMN